MSNSKKEERGGNKDKNTKKKDQEESKNVEELEKCLEEEKKRAEEFSKSLEAEKKKTDEYLNRLKYLQADFENYRKRVEREKEEIAGREKARLITRLLVILDELELAIKNGKEAEKKDILVEGVEMVYNKLQKLLCEEGLSEIQALGKPFNPELHEAALVVQTEEHPNNTVIEETRKGFMLNGKVVRPSTVIVAKKPVGGSC
ncbi:MAG: nucleotide exchange factor GrpE [Candidatus Jordarchaeaceae archaeon]